jgi:hypothetical protein
MRFVILLLLLSSDVHAKEWIKIRCAGAEVKYLPESFPHGMSERTICKCLRRRWQGPECDTERARREFHQWQARMQREIEQYIQPATVKGGKE